MKYVGVDLHKKVISVCVVKVVGERRQVDARARFDCADPPAIEKFFSGLKKFRMAVEATASSNGSCNSSSRSPIASCWCTRKRCA
jgi:hypothetical protein